MCESEPMRCSLVELATASTRSPGVGLMSFVTEVNDEG